MVQIKSHFRNKINIICQFFERNNFYKVRIMIFRIKSISSKINLNIILLLILKITKITNYNFLIEFITEIIIKTMFYLKMHILINIYRNLCEI